MTTFCRDDDNAYLAMRYLRRVSEREIHLLDFRDIVENTLPVMNEYDTMVELEQLDSVAARVVVIGFFLVSCNFQDVEWMVFLDKLLR